MPSRFWNFFWLAFANLAFANEPTAGDRLMAGSPPAPSELVTRENWLTPPYNVWGLQHVDQLLPTTAVDRGEGPSSRLDEELADLSGFSFTDNTGKRRTLDQFLVDQHVDALLLYVDGHIVQEIYRNGETKRTRHLMMSVTKSFTGLIAEMLIAEGKLDESKKIVDYIPQLNVPGGAYADATVRNLLNMEIGVDFAEIYDDPSSTIFQFAYAAGFRPVPAGVTAFSSLYEFLPSLKKKGEHGRDFHYVTANSEVLGWLIERVTSEHFARVFEQRVYGKIGAERDAFYVTDPHGKAVAGGGLNVTARDALRLAVMMATHGRFNGQQIVPAGVVEKIAAGGTPRPSLWGNENGGHDHSYRSQWYIEHRHHVLSASGIHGQTIHILPNQGVAMVVQSSYPDADGPFFNVLDDYFVAVAQHFKKLEQ